MICRKQIDTKTIRSCVGNKNGGHGMRNKKVLAIVMAVMTAASALVGCGSTEATVPADTAATTEK